MAVQARSRATRQRIIDVTVDLFYESGYAAVGLKEITARSGLTTGAFYYHFESKEELGAEIIKQAWPLWWEVLERHLGDEPGLEKVIALTFELSDLLRRDRKVSVAQNLNLAFYQVHEDVRSFEEEGTRASFEMLSEMIAADDIRGDITREELATQISMNIFGCHVLSGRMRDSAIARLTRSWLTLVRGTVPSDRVAHFEQVVAHTAAQYDETT